MAFTVLGPQPPYPAGFEAAEENVAIGEAVTGLAPGARVIGVGLGCGAFAEYAVPSPSTRRYPRSRCCRCQRACTRDQHGSYQPYGICVLTVTSQGIRHIRSFGDPGLVTLFGFGMVPS